MTTVYVVTEGSYSDYRLVAVFTDPELAGAHAKKVGGEVEEYPLITKTPKRLSIYSKSNANTPSGEPHEWSFLTWDYDRRLYKRAEVIEWKDNRRRVIRVQGWDQAAVRKAYDDRWAMVQAGLEGAAP